MRTTTASVSLVLALAGCHPDARVIDEEAVEFDPIALPDRETLIDVHVSSTAVDVYVTDPAEDCECDARFPGADGCVEFTDMSPFCACFGEGPILTASCVSAVRLVDKNGETLRERGRGPPLWTYVRFALTSHDAPAYDVTEGGHAIVIEGCGPPKQIELSVAAAPPPRVLATRVDEVWGSLETRFLLDEPRPQFITTIEGMGGRVCRADPSDTVFVRPIAWGMPVGDGRVAGILDLHGPVMLGLAVAQVWIGGGTIDRVVALTPIDDETDEVLGGYMWFSLRAADGERVSVPLKNASVTRLRGSGAFTLTADAASQAFTDPVLVSIALSIGPERDRVTLTYDDGTFSAEVLHDPRGEDSFDHIANFEITFAVDDLLLRDVTDPTRLRAASFAFTYDAQGVLVSDYEFVPLSTTTP
jgi:hypothetical protein